MTHNAKVVIVRDDHWDVDEYRGICDNCEWTSSIYPAKGRALFAAESHMLIHNRRSKGVK